MKIFGLKIQNRIMEGALSAKSTPTKPPPRVRWVPIDYSGPEPRFGEPEPSGEVETGPE